MSWLLLILSGLLETVWAVALEKSDGFTKPLPTAIFGVATIASMVGLGIALRDIPVGTGYAVWTGIGATGTALVGMLWLGESHHIVRVTCLVLIVAGVVGLKLFG